MFQRGKATRGHTSSPRLFSTLFSSSASIHEWCARWRWRSPTRGNLSFFFFWLKEKEEEEEEERVDYHAARYRWRALAIKPPLSEYNNNNGRHLRRDTLCQANWMGNCQDHSKEEDAECYYFSAVFIAPPKCVATDVKFSLACFGICNREKEEEEEEEVKEKQTTAKAPNRRYKAAAAAAGEVITGSPFRCLLFFFFFPFLSFFPFFLTFLLCFAWLTLVFSYIPPAAILYIREREIRPGQSLYR